MQTSQDNDPSCPSLVLNLDQELFAIAIRNSLEILSSLPRQHLPHDLRCAHSQVLVRLTWCLLQLPNSAPDRGSILSLNRFHARELAQALDPDLSRIQALLRTLR